VIAAGSAVTGSVTNWFTRSASRPRPQRPPRLFQAEGAVDPEGSVQISDAACEATHAVALLPAARGARWNSTLRRACRTRSNRYEGRAVPLPAYIAAKVREHVRLHGT
jgi:hypothetical protein